MREGAAHQRIGELRMILVEHGQAVVEDRAALNLEGGILLDAGDLIRLPMGISHGIFNKSEQPVKCFFWVTPTRALYDLFWAIHSMKEQKPEEVVALAAKYEVVFLPPPA